MNQASARTNTGACLPYTEAYGKHASGDMPIAWSRYITERAVLRVLITGFALVLLLLGAASVIALRATRAIQADADVVMREELNIARLLNQVQTEETALAAVLHEIIRAGVQADRDRLLQTLHESDAAVSRAAAASGHTPESKRWHELEQAVRQFSAEAERAILTGNHSEDVVRTLFTKHDRVIDLVNNLVSSSTRRAIAVDRVLAGRSRDLADESLALLGTCFFLGLLCAILTVRMATMSIRRIESQGSELGRVSWHMLQTQEETARRFSHELHDELGQSLAAIRANLIAGVSESDARKTDCIHLVDEAIANVRELSQLLRPVILDDFGLDAAMRWLTEKFSQRTAIAVRYTSNLSERLHDETETHLFRIAQEALTNVARHSGANAVSVELVNESGGVNLTIEDNGQGLPSGRSMRASVGMIGMRARARQLGGELSMSAPSGGGLRLVVRIPEVEVMH